jgi:hypothetical protein
MSELKLLIKTFKQVAFVRRCLSRLNLKTHAIGLMLISYTSSGVSERKGKKKREKKTRWKLNGWR